MKIKFWGVRGSIPCPGPKTVKYGGNTPCLELRFKDPDRLIIIDAGSGIRELGNNMMTNDHSKKSIRTEIFLTHTHWDHIQGFPFFTPVYIPGTKLKVYGPITYEDESIEDVLGGQWAYRYFPVRQGELAAEIEYVDLGESLLDLGDGIMLTTKYLNHPVLCLGYRFEYYGKVFCTAYDTEPFHNVFYTSPSDPAYDEDMVREGEQVAREENRRIEKFFSGADFLIHDTQYTHKEYEASRIGWGHSSCEHAIAAAKRAGVKRLALFHHDPMRTDAQIDELTKIYCNPDNSGDTEVFFAREGMEIEL
jgi:phosphoribosyl 1,2-cyclic phosphodiesterase